MRRFLFLRSCSCVLAVVALAGAVVIASPGAVYAWISIVRHSHADSTARAVGAAVGADGDVFAGGTLIQGSQTMLGAVRLDGATGTAEWKSAVLEGIGNGFTLTSGGLPVVVGAYENPAGFNAWGADQATIEFVPDTGDPLWIDTPQSSTHDWLYGVVSGAGGATATLGRKEDRFYVSSATWERTVVPFSIGGVDGWGVGRDAAFDANGDIVVVGAANEVYVRTFPSSPPQYGVGRPHLVVAKLSGATGATLWETILAETSNGVAVALDANGDVLAVGAADPVVEPAGGHVADDLVVVKLSGASGSELWRRTIDGGAGSPHDVGLDVAIDDEGGIIVASRLAISPNDPMFYGGVAEFAVLRLDSDGTELWRFLSPNTRFDVTPIVGGVAGAARSITFDNDGAPVVAGETNASWFGNGRGADFTVIKLDLADGTQQWVSVPGQGQALSVATATDGIVAGGSLEREGASGGIITEFAVVKLSEGVAGDVVDLQDGGSAARRRLKLSSKDKRITTPLADRLGDPRYSGARLVLKDPESGAEQAVDLPASGWVAKRGGYEFKGGPCKLVRVDNRRGLSAKCQGDEVSFPSGRPARGALSVRLELGPESKVQFCTMFGPGTVQRDDGVNFKAKNAPAPSGCV